MNRLPSTSCPSIMLLPRSCTCSGGSFGVPGICGIPGAEGADADGIGMTMASFFRWSSKIVFWLPGRVMMLVCGVSRRRLPLLDLHMRDADCVGAALPPAACVLVAHSEHEGGIGGTGETEGGCTVRKFTTAFPNQEAARSWGGLLSGDYPVLGGAGFAWRSASSPAINVLF